MPTSGRGPIKVGSGYIEINTRLSEETIKKFRADITKEMERAGEQAGKALSTTVTSGLADLPKAAATAARKAKEAIEGEAKDSAETLAAIEKELTKQFGAEAAKRFKEARQLEEQKQKLAEETSTVTRAALRTTMQQETEAAAARSRQTQQQEKERVSSIRRTAAEAAKAAQQETRQRQQALEDEARIDSEIAATQARMERERRAQILETARIRQQAQRTAIQTQLEETAAVRSGLTQQLDAVRLSMRQMQSVQTNAVSSFRKGWQNLSKDVEHFGTTSTELGNLINHNVVAPFGIAAGAAATFGIKSADAMIQAQTGLKGMGVQLQDVNSLLEQMTQYGINTPYSVTDMLTYGTRYARANAAHSHDFGSADPATRAKGSRDVAQRSMDMVKMVGDSAAFGGVMDPTMVSQGMYALEVIQDMGRVNLRNMKQLERATGIPAEQLAKLMGFRDRAYSAGELKKMKESDQKRGVTRDLPTTYDASAQMMDFMANAKDTGGINGDQLIDALLKHWKDPKSGVRGAAQRMGSATISGRVEQMKENAQYQLGQLFYTKGKDGSYEYSGLGQAIMGKKVEDQNGTHFEGGLLNDAKDIGKNMFPMLKQVLTEMINGLSTFTGWVKTISQYLKDHPGLTKMIAEAAKFAALMAPVLLGLGAMAKILGKTGKLIDAAVVKPALVAGRTARGAYSMARGGTFRQGYQGTRGRDAQTTQLTAQMRHLEDQIKEADRRLEQLRTSLREVNAVNLRAVADALAGGGPGGRSVASAAQQAHTEVHQVLTQAIEPLDRSNLNHVTAELNATRERALTLKTAVESVHQAVTSLDGRNLNSLHGEFRSVETVANSLYDKIGQGTGAGSVAGRVGLLNGRSLNGLKDEFQKVHTAAESVFEKIGQGTGAGSLAGRVGLLNGRTLSGLKAEFEHVYKAANDAHDKVGMGTGGTSLAGRVGLLNDRSLSAVTERVDKLGTRLAAAALEAKALDNAIDNVSKRAPGGSSSGPTKKKKFSTGGVLPGYMPGVDSIPAILSPGESILRPEVTAALGPGLINHWNAMARKGHISRFAKGGIVGKLGAIKEIMKLQNVLPIGEAALSTMAFDATSDGIGGDAKKGMLGTTLQSDRWLGSQLAQRFGGMYDFVAQDSWKYMRDIPTVIGQAIGILGGSVAPILGDYFWNDVWKGDGNILLRGGKFLDDTFSFKTVTGAFKNLVGGGWDSLKSIFGGAKDLITHPIDTVSGAFSAIWDVAGGEIDQITDMVSMIKQIYSSPLDYAGQVFGDMYDTAKDALPNMSGLFDFSDGQKVLTKKPDFAKMLGGGDTPTGDAVNRWTPTVQRVLKELGLSEDYTSLVLHRIQVESGGNPSAINTWDSNAKAGHPSQGLMQTIPSTFDAYAGPYKGLGIMNGLASIYAGLNYATHRYGSGWPAALSGNKGYWMGTLSASPGLRLVGENGPELVNFRGGERVYNNRDTSGMFNGRKYEVHVHEAKSENTTQATFRALQQMEALYGI